MADKVLENSKNNQNIFFLNNFWILFFNGSIGHCHNNSNKECSDNLQNIFTSVNTEVSK